jgi:hypothetical protein
MRTIKAKALAISGLATIQEFGFTTAELADSDLATIATTADIKFLYDGSDPTASFGLPLIANTMPAIEEGSNIRNLKFYGTATVTVLLERQ